MAFKITQWALSNIPEDQIKDSAKMNVFKEKGLKTVKIIDALYRGQNEAQASNKNTYLLTIECIEGGADAGAKAHLTYWLCERDSNLYNSKTMGTMQSLGKAIFGSAFPPNSFPNPADILGAVVMADIDISKPDPQGRTFTRVYRFEPASQDFMAFSDIEQIYREVANVNGGVQN